MLIGFPLLLIPLAICNIIVFLMPTLSLTAPLFTVPLMSGAAWSVTLSDMLIAFGVFLLWLEVMKARHPGAKYLTDHFLSLLVFGGAAAEFVMLPQFGSSTFFLLTLIALVDFLAGVSLRARRPRRVAAAAPAPVATPPVAAPAPANVEPITAEPRFTPAPTPVSAPPVTTATEDVAVDHVQPVMPVEPSHEIIVPPRHDVVVAPEPALPSQASPDLQPSSPNVPPAR